MAEERTSVITPKFRVCFPHVFTPQAPRDGNGEPKYKLVAVFPPGTDLTQLKQLAQQAVVDKWGADPAKWPGDLKNPFKDGATRSEKYGEPFDQPGSVFINLSSKYPPGVVDRSVQPIIDQTQFYGGCYAVAEVHAFTYDNLGRGVSFGFSNVQKVADGKALGGRRDPKDVFAPVQGEEGLVPGAAAPAAGQDQFLQQPGTVPGQAPVPAPAPAQQPAQPGQPVPQPPTDFLS